jgi:hypothetical protein
MIYLHENFHNNSCADTFVIIITQYDTVTYVVRIEAMLVLTFHKIDNKTNACFWGSYVDLVPFP